MHALSAATCLPSWCGVESLGEKDEAIDSIFSAYVDLLPQVLDVIDYLHASGDISEVFELLCERVAPEYPPGTVSNRLSAIFVVSVAPEIVLKYIARRPQRTRRRRNHA
jgi:hypothetical protein